MFLPGIGFRGPGVRLARPVSQERAGRTVTVTELVSTTSGTDLEYEFTCLEGDTDLWRHETTLLRSGSREFRGAPGPLHSSVRPGKIVRGLSLAPIPSDIRQVDLMLSGGVLGDWSFPLELAAFPSGGVTEATALDASDTREGITIHVRAIAVTPEATALQLEVLAQPPVCMIGGIGGMRGMREAATALTLRDQTGRVFPERIRPDARDQFPNPTGRGDVALFDALPPDAHELELDVPFVIVEESTPAISIELPVTRPTDVMLGPFAIQVLGSRAADADKPWHRGPALAVDLDLGGWQRDRRVLKPGQVAVDGKPGGFGFGGGMRGPAPEALSYIEIPVAEPEKAKNLTLSMATVQVRGPWRVRFARPAQ